MSEDQASASAQAAAKCHGGKPNRNHQPRQKQRTITSLLLLASILISSLMISRPLFLLTFITFLGWAVMCNLGPRFQPLQRVAPAGALVPLTLAALIAAQLGLPRWWAYLAVCIPLLVLLAIQIFSRRCAPISDVFPSPVLMTALVPFLSLAIAAAVWPGMAFAWAMIGDGYSEFQLMGLYREVPAGDFFPTHYPLATSGHLLIADSLHFTSSYLGLESFIADLQAMAAVPFFFPVMAVVQLQLAYGVRLQTGRALIQGFALGVMTCSGLIIGLPASNGIINAGPTIFFYSSLVVLTTSIFFRLKVPALAGALLILFALLSTWQPVAITGLGLVVGALAYRFFLSRWRALAVVFASSVGVVVIFALYEVFSRIARGGPGLPGVHGNFYFPMTPLAVFALMAVIALSTAHRQQLRVASLIVSSGALAGTLCMLIGMRLFDVFEVLAGTFVVSSTPYYYLYKYIWQVSVPIVILAGVAATNLISIRPRQVSHILLASMVVGATYVSVTNPNVPWIPKSSQPTIVALGEEFGQDTSVISPTLYFNVQGEAVDESLSNWWLWQNRKYVQDIRSREWLEARQTWPQDFPKWKEAREAWLACQDDQLACDQFCSLVQGLEIVSLETNKAQTAQVCK